MLVTACGSSSTAGNTVSSNAPKEAQTTTQTAPAATATTETAKPKSDKLTVYVAGPGKMAAKIKEDFEAKTGVKVEQFDGTTGKI
ncbi:ABC transporter substrate-binding protein, partial [Bacillus sp. SIMBA_069]